MSKKCYFLLLFYFILLSHELMAQCGHSYLQNKAFAQQPSLQSSLQQNRKLAQNKSYKTQSNFPDTALYIIPVVIHVIHNNGPEKISTDQILSAFPALNQDFRNMVGSRGKNAGVDSRIEFALATKDPNGNPHTGINFIQSPLTNHNMDNDLNLKDLIRWPNTEYLNIWLVKEIGGSSGGTTLGYAYYPGISADYDGIVIRSDCWGSKEFYSAGNYFSASKYNRTATHEIGHYLNLPHTFDGGCNWGDDISDTPPVEDSNFGCPTRINSCGNDISQGASVDKIDQVRNYMDYADNHCADMFTMGQTLVMHDAINQHRLSLTTPSNHQATGVGKFKAPHAHFWTTQQVLCSGHSTQLIDLSSGKPTTWNWTIVGGTPYDSLTFTIQNPIVTLTNPGRYDVRLTVGNGAGNSAQTVRTNVFSVGQDIGALPIVEGFEPTTFPPSGWRLENPNKFNPEDSIAWSRYLITGGFRKSMRSARINNFSSRSIGQWDALVLPKLDLTNETNLYFSFSKSYVQMSITDNFPLILSDTLYLEYSTDCGDHWETAWVQGGADLATDLPYDGALANMDSSQWQRVDLNLSNLVGNHVQFRFRSVFYGGNNLYLDDIVVDRLLASDNQVNKKLYVQMYPNPGKEILNISLLTNQNSESQMILTDIQGKIISHQSFTGSEVQVSTENLNCGMYFVEIHNGSEKFVQKWVKE